MIRVARAMLVALLTVAGGCSGGSHDTDDGATGGEPPSPPPPPTGGVTLTLTAHDAFGTPVPDASIVVLVSSGTGFRELEDVTDADGRLEVPGAFEDAYAIIVTAPELWGASYEPSHPDDDTIDFVVTLHPLSAFTPGVAELTVTSHSANGQRLEFSARLYVIEGRDSSGGDYEQWNFASVNVLPCAPDDSNDGTTFTVDCVEAAGGQDFGYQGSTLSKVWVDPDPSPDPLSVALLLDQGASLADTDPGDRRLLAAKYFQTRLAANDHVALAAFATDDAGSGDVALLPSKPVTIYPVDNPSFTTDGPSYFETIDSLASLEGGASPLHAALGELIDFAAISAPANSRKAVVVLASDGATECATPADCLAAQDELRERSNSSGVAVVTVGLSPASGNFDRKKLGTLAQSETGAVFWAHDATQVPTVFGRMPAILGGRHGALDVTVRLDSPVAGAFASGNTVVGTLEVVVCPWDCTELVQVPFALRVP